MSEKYLHAKQLAGKYFICTGIVKEKMDKQEVKQYKKLQNAEHAFRDFKSRYIQVRPVFIRDKVETRGHKKHLEKNLQQLIEKNIRLFC